MSNDAGMGWNNQASQKVTMKTNPEVCQICRQPLALSRRDVYQVGVAVKQAANGRYFVPDNEVHAIVHRIHTKLAPTESLEVESELVAA